MIFRLYNFPMPPSVNALYANNRFNGGRGRFKTKEYHQFEKDVLIWSKFNSSILNSIKESFKQNEKFILEMKYAFYFERSKIFCKNGKPKRNDTSNRIKALEDSLSKLIDIDDCYFWEGAYNKYPLKEHLTTPHVDILIKLDTLD